MFQGSIETDTLAGYGAVAFSARMKRVLGRRPSAPPTVRRASRDDAIKLHEVARRSLPSIIPRHVLLRTLRYNPDILRIIDVPAGSEDSPAFFAYLPLKPEGVSALLEGALNVAQPDTAMLCASGVEAAALYIWLLYAPGAMLPTLQALAPVLAELAPGGCPLYMKAATPAAQRLFVKAGFEPVTGDGGRHPDGLMIVPPLGDEAVDNGEEAGESSGGTRVRVARTIEDLMKSFSVRAATYMAEQRCPFDEEFDGNDFCSTHFIGELDGEPAGCIRVRFFADFVKIERLAVRTEFRGSKLALHLVQAAIFYARRKGYRRAYGHSRTDLLDFWGRFGFAPLPDKPSFTFSDMEYVEVEADLDGLDQRIMIGDDPYRLIRPEGDWDRPGPLDRSAGRSSDQSGL